MRGFLRTTRAVWIASLAASAACSNSGPRYGVLIVGNTTYGSEIPSPLSYTITVDGADSANVEVNAGTTLLLTPTTHSIGLTGLPANCQVDPRNGGLTNVNPASVQMARGDTSEVWFGVKCL